MRKIRIFFRSIRDSFKNVFRNFSLSLASIFCVVITLIIVSVALVLAANINNATKSIKDELSIVVYVKNDSSKEDVENLEADVNTIKNVIDIKFVSKEEEKNSLSLYSDTFKTILDYLDENPLLDTLVVSVDDVKELSTVAGKIKELKSVESVKYGEGMVEEVISAFDIIEKATLVMVAALGFVTIFLISNTIKITVYSRRNEIEIMRLVGASNSSIKLPFLFEGLLIGIIGSIIPICVTIYGYVILYNVMNGHLFTEMLTLVNPYNFVFYVSGILLILGSLVGAFGSMFATKKYLKI